MRFLIFLISFANLVHAVSFEDASQEIVDAGKFLNQSNLCPATSGNISMRVDDLIPIDLIAITVSGKHKGELTTNDVMLVNLEGQSLMSSKRPSAETLMHTTIYQLFGDVGAVLHTHTLNGTVLSQLVAPEKALITQGYEIHKAFTGIKTHESEVVIPIFENSQDMVALAKEVTQYLKEHPQTYGFLLRGHGFYTWGKDMREAKIRIETFEYLFESELKLRSLTMMPAMPVTVAQVEQHWVNPTVSFPRGSVSVILTDIEGTTTSLSFVQQVLFPYTNRENMDKYVRDHQDQLSALIDEVKKIAETPDANLEQVIDTLVTWKNEDKKITPLKTLQGMMWEDGYQRGDFKGHVYEDAHALMEKWHTRGFPLYIYSSGSVQAQKLLYSHSTYGDMTPLLAGYFDTKTGPKKEATSYSSIAQKIGVHPDLVLFLSDSVEELDAARAAGMKTLFLSRDGAPVNGPHRSVTTFDQIDLQ